MTDDIEARVARVLAEHYADNCCGMDCECGWVYAGWDEYAAHVAAVLAEAHLLADWHATYLRLRALTAAARAAQEDADAARAELEQVKAERDRCHKQELALLIRVETAAAEHADLVARIEALADNARAQYEASDYSETATLGDVADALRAALRGDGEATT